MDSGHGLFNPNVINPSPNCFADRREQVENIRKLEKQSRKLKKKHENLKSNLNKMDTVQKAQHKQRDEFLAKKQKLCEAHKVIHPTNEKITAENKKLRYRNELMQAKLDEKDKICRDYKGMCEGIENDRLRQHIETIKKDHSSVERIFKEYLKKELAICHKKVSKVTELVRARHKETEKLRRICKKREKMADSILDEKNLVSSECDRFRIRIDHLETEFLKSCKCHDTVRDENVKLSSQRTNGKRSGTNSPAPSRSL